MCVCVCVRVCVCIVELRGCTVSVCVCHSFPTPCSLQAGEYEIPDWLTPSSVGMIARLLQVSASSTLDLPKIEIYLF